MASREIILVRHAHAETATADEDDLARGLSLRGEAEADAAGAWLKQHAAAPERVLYSPAARSRETCERVLTALGYTDLRSEARIYEATPAALLRVLDDHEHRAGARQGFQLYAECCKRFLPALFRNRLQSGVASVVRKRQHLGQQPRVLPGRRGLRQQRIELVELCLRCVAVRKSGGTFELPDDRIKSAVCVLWRAEITQPRVWFGRDVLHERSGEPGFADPGLTR